MNTRTGLAPSSLPVHLMPHLLSLLLQGGESGDAIEMDQLSPQTKLREGNVFTDVCHSVQAEGVVPRWDLSWVPVPTPCSTPWISYPYTPPCY